MRLICLFLMVMLAECSLAQSKEGVAETQPGFPGGIPAFHKYVSANLNLSNKQIRKLKGKRLVMQFMVNAEGNVTGESVLPIERMTTIEDPEVIKATQEIIRKSPSWTPGTRNGKPIGMMLVLPIDFKTIFQR